jgi:hypothetical protein
MQSLTSQMQTHSPDKKCLFEAILIIIPPGFTVDGWEKLRFIGMGKTAVNRETPYRFLKTPEERNPLL